MLNDSAAKLLLAVPVLEVKDGNGTPRVTRSSTLVLPIFHLNEQEIASLTMSAVSSTFRAHDGTHSEEERHFALEEKWPIQPRLAL